jgi:hypothetical protein
MDGLDEYYGCRVATGRSSVSFNMGCPGRWVPGTALLTSPAGHEVLNAGHASIEQTRSAHYRPNEVDGELVWYSPCILRLRGSMCAPNVSWEVEGDIR